MAVIGTFAALLGGILYLPFYIWKRLRLRNKPAGSEFDDSPKITRMGVTFYGIQVLFLLIGSIQEYLAPESAFGRFISTWSGKLIYAAVVVAVFAILQLLLASKGIALVERHQKNWRR